MVDERLATIREIATGSKKVFDGHVLSIDRITSDAKRKWEDFSMQAETDAKIMLTLLLPNTAELSHCYRNVLMLLNRLLTIPKRHNCVVEMGREHVTEVDSLVSLYRKYGHTVVELTVMNNKHLSFQVADALNQPFPDGKFNLVWSMESGEQMPDKLKFVSKLARVAAPGATIIIVTWCHMDLSPTEESMRPRPINVELFFSGYEDSRLV